MTSRDRVVLYIGVWFAAVAVCVTAFKAEKLLTKQIDIEQNELRLLSGRGGEVHSTQIIYVITRSSDSKCQTFPPSIPTPASTARSYPEFAVHPDSVLPDEVVWQSWDSAYTVVFPNSPIKGVSDNMPISVAANTATQTYQFSGTTGSFPYDIKDSTGNSCLGGTYTGVQVDR